MLSRRGLFYDLKKIDKAKIKDMKLKKIVNQSRWKIGDIVYVLRANEDKSQILKSKPRQYCWIQQYIVIGIAVSGFFPVKNELEAYYQYILSPGPPFALDSNIFAYHYDMYETIEELLEDLDDTSITFDSQFFVS